MTARKSVMRLRRKPAEVLPELDPVEVDELSATYAKRFTVTGAECDALCRQMAMAQLQMRWAWQAESEVMTTEINRGQAEMPEASAITLQAHAWERQASRIMKFQTLADRAQRRFQTALDRLMRMQKAANRDI
jgi:hypothetical protein